MDNIQMAISGNRLLLQIDLIKVGLPSKSGRSRLVASTNGAIVIGGYAPRRLRLSLNVMASPVVSPLGEAIEADAEGPKLAVVPKVKRRA